MNCELREAFAAWRDGLPMRCNADGKPEGIAVELIDALDAFTWIEA